ncbi:hypothetical protein ACH5RR_039428 [Cinchona calisaya]|uniref:Uncharacterized protein n=1 Tax=Cinchona calisaya TaxID=153742 RepID=A0ABD2Y3E7_9GENT
MFSDRLLCGLGISELAAVDSVIIDGQWRWSNGKRCNSEVRRLSLIKEISGDGLDKPQDILLSIGSLKKGSEWVVFGLVFMIPPSILTPFTFSFVLILSFHIDLQ